VQAFKGSWCPQVASATFFDVRTPLFFGGIGSGSMSSFH